MSQFEMDSKLPTVIECLIDQYVGYQNGEVGTCTCTCKYALRNGLRNARFGGKPSQWCLHDVIRYVSDRYPDEKVIDATRGPISPPQFNKIHKAWNGLRSLHFRSIGSYLFPCEIRDNLRTFQRWQVCRCCERHGKIDNIKKLV